MSTATVQDQTNFNDDKQNALQKLLTLIAAHIDSAYEERIAENRVSYVVPHTLFPAGYHCDPKKPLGYMSIVLQKNVLSIHHMGLYGSQKLMDWFMAEYPKHSKAKLDMGKACIRFKKMEDIPYDLIGQLAGKLSAQQWMDVYEAALRTRTKQ
jgi:uncharacterized protein YdhG (YjbR/CyaY superfamily)